MNPTAAPDLLSKVSSSEIYQTYSRIFDWAFELPLYVELGGRSRIGNPCRRSDFCMSVSQGDGCCTRCPLSRLPQSRKLEPWVWSASCAAGLQVTLAPLVCGGLRHGWLVTGHHAAGCRMGDDELVRNCRNAGIPLSDEQLRRYHEVPVLLGNRYEGMKHYLELAGAMIGSELNSIQLAQGPAETEWTRSLKHYLRTQPVLCHEAMEEKMENRFMEETGLSTLEYLQRWKMEEARREIVIGHGRDAEIMSAARRCGWWDSLGFQQMFVRIFAETPKEHVRRMKKVEQELWMESVKYA